MLEEDLGAGVAQPVIAEGQGSPEPVGEGDVDVVGSPGCAGDVIGGGAAYYSPELASPAKNSCLTPSK